MYRISFTLFLTLADPNFYDVLSFTHAAAALSDVTFVFRWPKCYVSGIRWWYGSQKGKNRARDRYVPLPSRKFSR